METPRKHGKDGIINELDVKKNIEVSKEEVRKADTSGSAKVNEKGRTDGDEIDNSVTDDVVKQTKINPACNDDVLTENNEIGNKKGRTDGNTIEDSVGNGEIPQSETN